MYAIELISISKAEKYLFEFSSSELRDMLEEFQALDRGEKAYDDARVYHGEDSTIKAIESPLESRPHALLLTYIGTGSEIIFTMDNISFKHLLESLEKMSLGKEPIDWLLVDNNPQSIAALSFRRVA